LYEYQTTVQVYDSLGSTHDITLYFDKADPTASPSTYEFMITCNPGEDKRDNGGNPIDASTDGHAGLLGYGTIEFEPGSGAISNIEMTSIDGSGTPTVLSTDPADTNYGLDNGLFTFGADFLGGGADPMTISLDFGSTYNGSIWANNALSTTQYAVSSNTIFKDANGYGAGDLQDINVNDKGVITGNYSNGEIIPLYRVALAGFQNEQGLVKEGGNLFRATLASGAAITNRPGSNGLGTIAPGSLEQSNVDIAGEFVEMISTQRGFQANSKIITTVDTMLSEIINLKR
jgi:flagellar hook protein FlgE